MDSLAGGFCFRFCSKDSEISIADLIVALKLEIAVFFCRNLAIARSTGESLPLLTMIDAEIIAVARETIRLEAESINALSANMGADFVSAVQQIHHCKGRVVISGIGKSAIIAQKIAATLNSTGTPAMYMHAADAIHGDLGMVRQEDIVLILSKSGNSPEIKVLVPLIRNFGNLLIAMAGNMESFLARNADLRLDTTVSQEACPNNLAPTSSTTAQMVMGDALAVCLMKVKGFSGEDFAKFHPGGTLGKKLYLRVADLIADNPRPEVHPDSNLAEIVLDMTHNRLGATVVTHNEGEVYGIITDGDLRRMIGKNLPAGTVLARDICTRNPKQIAPDELAVNGLDLMRKNDITHLVVVKENKYLGVLHLHDLIKEGLI